MTVLPVGIEFTHIPELNPGDQIIVHVDVGNMPTSVAEKYVTQVKEAFQAGGHMAPGVKYIFAPIVNGQRSINIEVGNSDS